MYMQSSSPNDSDFPFIITTTMNIIFCMWSFFLFSSLCTA
jgi:hypothetical protein